MLREHFTTITDTLDDARCWYFRGAFHFALDHEGAWTLALSVDSMSRVRLDTCYLGSQRASRWVNTDDAARLAAVVRELRDEATAMTEV